jgi:hypothetical protein
MIHWLSWLVNHPTAIQQRYSTKRSAQSMKATVDQQTQGSFNYYPVLYKADGSKLIQYDPIQEVNQLLSLLSADDTSATYQKATAKTWTIFKKAIVLFLFLFCLVIALPIWISGIGFQSGFHFRKWLEDEQPPLEKIVDLLLAYLAKPFQQAYAWASGFIESYLNLKISFDASEPTSPSPKPVETAPAPQK